MAEIPAPQNHAANLINKILEVAIMDVGVRLAKAAAVAELPFLGWPGISQVFDYLLQKIGRYFYLGGAQFATFNIIDAQIRGELGAVNEVIPELQRAIESGDPEAIKKAEEEFKKRYADLIRSNGEARIK